MNRLDENPSVSIKRKNIHSLIDYCLENKLEFTIKPRISGVEEWDIEFHITSIKTAVALGMFLHEVKVELNGFHANPTLAVSKSKKASFKENGITKEESVASLTFEEDNLQLNIDNSANN